MVRVLTFGLRADLMGGIEKFVFTMAGEMQGECVFDYVFLDTEKPIHQDLIKSLGGVAYTVPYYARHPFRYVWSLFRLLRRLRGETDAVYVNLFSMVHIFPILLARLMGYKVMAHAHNNNIQHTNCVYHLIHQAGKRVCSRLHCLRLTNSHESAVYMFGAKKGLESVLVYNAIDVAAFAFSAERRRLVRKRLGVSDGTCVVGFSGRLDLQKNPLFVVDVFECFRQTCPDSVLLMAGEGPLRRQVETLIEQKRLQGSVKMLGLVANMADMYQAMDVFLLPSLFEGLGIVLVEAQAAGLPCLTTQDTVPDFVSVTPLVHRESLRSTAAVWAGRLAEMLNVDSGRLRSSWQAALLNTSFDIHTEGNRFAEIIKKFVQS